MAKKNPTVRYEYVSPDCGLVSFLSEIEDPRRDHGKRHKLEDILTIALCTILTGHSEFTEMEFFGELREDWLSGFLELPNGIPSHDTFRNVFCAIDPEAFLEVFARWTCCVREKSSGEIIAFDGKALRGTKGGQDNIRTVVGAWAVGAGISLGQVDVEGKSNEWERSGHRLPSRIIHSSQITALPKLLEFLDLKGCIVTADAMGCQKEVARRAVAARADYVLAVKGNQPSLLEQVSGYLDGLITDGLEVHVSENQAHGRKEVRRCWVADQLGWMGGA